MENNINIVTYNIHNGFRANQIIKNVGKLAGRGVNIFCLQELRKFSGREFLLNSLLKTLGTEWQAQYLIEPESRNLGLCTLWKTPGLEAINFEFLLLPRLQKPKLYQRAAKKISREYEKLADKYLGPAQRAALIGNFKFQGRTLRVTNLHLDWQGGLRHRSSQLKLVHSHLEAKTKADFEILCGDFNSLGFYGFYKRRNNKIHGLLGAEFKNAFQKKPTTHYLQTLDHIFVKNLAITNAGILKYKGSDHFPLLAEMKI